MLFNARSLCNKTVGVTEFLKENKCDICFVTEAWIKMKDESVIAELLDLGYEIKFQPRKGSRRGGGVCVLYKPDLNVNKCNIKSYKSFEVLQVTIKSLHSFIRVSTFYRTGKLSSNKRAVFINELDNYLESLIRLKGENVLCGDFNIHVENEKHIDTSSLYSVTNSYGFTQIIKESTQRSGGTLDLLFLRDDSNLKQLADKSIYVHELSYSLSSDHNFIECFLPFVKDAPKPMKKYQSYRNYNGINIEQFCHDFEISINNRDFFNLELNDSLDCFNNTIAETINIHAPLINKCFVSKKTEFTNSNILNLRRLRRKYERRYRKLKNPDDLQKYNQLVAEVRKAVTCSRNQYYCNGLSKHENNKKQKFKILNSILGKQKKVILPDTASDKDLCDDFEQFFIGKIINVRNDIVMNDCTPVLHQLSEPTSCNSVNSNINPFDKFLPITGDQLAYTMSELSNKDCELDVIPTDFFKACSRPLSSYILNIINSSLCSGIFPDSFKNALVRPVLKNSSLDKNDLSNYRPISNVCFFSKLLEKCALKQLIFHLNTHDLLGHCQSAYRQFHSCETALTKVTNDILNNLDHSFSTFIIMLDLSAAFDTVDHSILFERLETCFHITGVALQWFKSYLSNRSFNVKIKCSISNGVITLYGVPQGSILGPILFLLYISEIERIAKFYGLKLHMFADDMQLYISFQRSHISSSISNIEHCLRHIKLWMSSNFLKINEDKTKFLVISPKNNNCNMFTDLCISFGGSIIEPSPTATNLGVTLDSSMTMCSYINSITSKGYFYLHNFYRVADKLTYTLKVQLVTTYILPLLDYNNILLFSATTLYRTKLQKLLNNAVRFIFNMSDKRMRRKSISPYLKKLHILPIESRIIYKLCLLVYKSVNGLAPKYLSDLIEPKISYAELRSSNDFFCLDYKLPHSMYGEHAYSYIAPYYWNKLPLNLRMAPSVEVFKTSLKTHLFSIAFNNN